MDFSRRTLVSRKGFSDKPMHAVVHAADVKRGLNNRMIPYAASILCDHP
jgi:hypothetical protein